MAENPLKRLRLDEGFTINYVAEKLQTSRQYVIRAEQGTYNLPSPLLLDFYGVHHPSERSQIAEEYGEFQVETRRSNYGRLVPKISFSDHLHPFIYWRQASGISSLMAVCRYFCIQHAIAYKWETQPLNIIYVPSMVLTALSHAGYTDELGNLEVAYSRYRESLFYQSQEQASKADSTNGDAHGISEGSP